MEKIITLLAVLLITAQMTYAQEDKEEMYTQTEVAKILEGYTREIGIAVIKDNAYMTGYAAGKNFKKVTQPIIGRYVDLKYDYCLLKQRAVQKNKELWGTREERECMLLFQKGTARAKEELYKSAAKKFVDGYANDYAKQIERYIDEEL